MVVDRFAPSSPSRRPRYSRRTTLTASGLGFAAAMGLMAPRVVARQDGLPQVVADFAAGWEALDPDQIADLYAEDATSEDVPSGTVLQGREAIRGYLVEFIGAFSDATAEIPTAFATESQAAVEWIFRGNYTGALPGFPPGTGQPITDRGFTLVEFSEDAIQRTVDFYDVYGILVQLGVVPAPSGTPEATPAG